MPQKSKRRGYLSFQTILGVFLLLFCTGIHSSWAVTLKEIRERGTLRHLGFPYSQFVTPNHNGLDVDIIKLFAQHLGVRYEFVESPHPQMLSDLTGKEFTRTAKGMACTGSTPVRGDVAAAGITVSPWREKVVRFSIPTFPTQVWLMARADSPLKPIIPAKQTEDDILAVKQQLRGVVVAGVRNTSIDPDLYELDAYGAKAPTPPIDFRDHLGALLQGKVDAVLADEPDALLLLGIWPGKLKVIGPISEKQQIAMAFAPESQELLEAFNAFLHSCMNDGSYDVIINRYYPEAARNVDAFIEKQNHINED
ncbi:MAG: transporter substrate-binding domain-containing protein [Halodesulfovibrio sp.]